MIEAEKYYEALSKLETHQRRTRMAMEMEKGTYDQRIAKLNSMPSSSKPSISNTFQDIDKLLQALRENSKRLQGLLERIAGPQPPPHTIASIKQVEEQDDASFLLGAIQQKRDQLSNLVSDIERAITALEGAT